MSYIFLALLILVSLGIVAWVFINADASSIAWSFKLVIPVALLAIGIIATIAGRGQYGIPAVMIAIAWWYAFLRHA